MQIMVTDHNEWEYENFYYVLEVSEYTATKIKTYAEINDFLEIELDTEYSQYDIDLINKFSNNGYMNRIGYYRLKEDIDNVTDIYEDIFYKGVGLAII